jgi:predicted O-linked N-acetylglucosamine transferase (SPINDLY family)
LLKAVPDSVLWLLSTSTVAADNLLREAGQRGIASERLVFATMLPLEQHLGRLQLADLALDTFPYNSHTTGSDALWAGVPLVTRMGRTFASRVAASMLYAVEFPELVTHDWDGYFSLAQALALDSQRLAALRRRLMNARLKAPLFDTQRFTRNLERLYDRIWEQHVRGQKETIVLHDPAGISATTGH